MPVTDYLEPSGRFTKKARGLAYRASGIIWVKRGTHGQGVDEHLWAILKLMADQLRIAIAVSSLNTGTHSPNSRHFWGLAADLSRLAEYDSSLGLMEREVESLLEKNPVTMRNPQEPRIVSWLLRNGFQAGEGRPRPAFLYGPPRSRYNPSTVDHTDHIHISLARRRHV